MKAWKYKTLAILGVLALALPVMAEDQSSDVIRQSEETVTDQNGRRTIRRKYRRTKRTHKRMPPEKIEKICNSSNKNKGRWSAVCNMEPAARTQYLKQREENSKRYRKQIQSLPVEKRKAFENDVRTIKERHREERNALRKRDAEIRAKRRKEMDALRSKYQLETPTKSK